MVKSYSSIIKIDEAGIKFDDGECLLFSECKEHYHNNYRYVADRDITAQPPYFVFNTATPVKIVFDCKGIFAKNKNRKLFNKMRTELLQLGYSTRDLS